VGVTHKDNWKRVTGVRTTIAKDPTDLMHIIDLVAGPGILITPTPQGVEWRSTGTMSGVAGPVGSVLDDSIARFDGSGGASIQDSLVTIDDFGNLVTSGTVDASGGFFGVWLGDTIGADRGGTGRTSLVAGGLLIGAGGITPFTELAPANSGDILTIIGGTPVWVSPSSAITLDGDASGPVNSVTVSGLQNRLVSSSAPSADDVLTWTGSQWEPQASVGGGAGAGAISSGEITVISSASGNVTSSHSLVLVTQSGSATVALQGSFVDGKVLYIKDAFNGATDRGVNTITIIQSSGQTIDYNVTAEIVNATQSLTLILASSVWYLV